MTASVSEKLDTLLFFFFALFAFGSTFSIALAQTSLGLALICFLVILAVKRYNPILPSLERVYFFIGLYLFWMILTALAGATPLASLFILKEEWLFVVIPIGIYLFSSPSYRLKLVFLFAVGVMLLSIYGILQHFTGVHWFRSTPLLKAPDFGYLVNGNFTHRLTFGNYYATATLFLLGMALSGREVLSKNQRLFLIFTSLLSMIVTVLTYSRGAIFALAVGLVVLGIIVGRKYLLYSLGIVVVVVTVILIIMPGLTARFTGKTGKDMGGVYEGGRVFIWKHSWEIVREHPLFGVGQGNFKDAYTAHLRPDIPEFRKYAHAHNDVLNYAAIAGIPGALIYLGLWGAVLSVLLRTMKSSPPPGRSFAVAAFIGSVVFFMTSLFEATFADEEVRQLLMFIWAAGLWTVRKKEKKVIP